MASTKSSLEICGHANKQHYGTSGKLEDILCTLPKGHTGDHHAKYMRKVSDPITDQKGIVIQQRYNDVEDDAYWNDAAGTPAAEIKAGEVPQLTQFQTDLVADILERNPGMDAKEAVTQARNSSGWSLGNA